MDQQAGTRRPTDPGTALGRSTCLDRFDRFRGLQPGKPCCARPPARLLLIRPDGYVAWAATPDEPTAQVLHTLKSALTTWFGTGHTS
ncbi:hypothetical protein [Streptomyces sp. NPDC093707]|uniref:aromatic-ring hydroxylase C-terminal domain-containing protein n=1 Tax=Streptomyces sp. NPDC093707 TaxID=3154984 RepID=UPI003450F487